MDTFDFGLAFTTDTALFHGDCMTSVLIVDDEPELRDSVARALAAEGYRVLQAGNGFEALELFVAHRPDVVVTEIYVPEKNGLELVREIRALDPEVRLIAMSGGGITGEFLCLGMIRELGAHDTIRKPFGHRELVAVIERVLRDE